NKSPEIIEYSHFGLSMALMAGMIGVPFMPTRGMIGSDIPKYNENVKEIDCPFTGVNTGLVKAIVPDVGIIHTQRCDDLGNAQKWGSLGMDVEGINASKTVIVTTEKIVNSDIIRRDPNRTIIPGFRVSAVVEAPWGAYPMHLGGCYNGDQFGFMFEIMRKEGYEPYVEKLIYGVRDWDEYLKVRREMKGEEYWKNLEIKNQIFSEPIPAGY
ncbi:CoA transferase subunit A, partial [Chloroflexota bacterium]